MADGDSLLRSVEAGDEVRFDGALTVGRDPGNGMVLGFEKISRRHAVIEWAEGAWWIRDLGSVHGTSVNGEPVVRARTIRRGDTLRFGTRSSWKVVRLAARVATPAAVAVIENLRSGLCEPVIADRLLIGCGLSCGLRVPEWIDGGDPPPIRAILYVESERLWLYPQAGLPGVAVDGEPVGDEPLAVDRPRALALGGTTLRITPSAQVPGRGPTQGVTAGSSRADLELVLEYEQPVEGVLRVRGPGIEWSTAVDGNRFILLVLLARAGGEWVPDRQLEVDLWGHQEISRDILHRLIHATRRVFIARGVDGWLLEKHRGKTRLRLPADRIHRRHRDGTPR